MREYRCYFCLHTAEKAAKADKVGEVDKANKANKVGRRFRTSRVNCIEAVEAVEAVKSNYKNSKRFRKKTFSKCIIAARNEATFEKQSAVSKPTHTLQPKAFKAPVYIWKNILQLLVKRKKKV